MPVKQMQYCKKCGEEVEDGAEFCPHCGADLRAKEILYTKPGGGGWDAGKVLVVLFGGFLILVGVPILIGGTALMGITQSLDDGYGYIGVSGVDLETDTQAIVFKPMHIDEMVIDEIDGPMVKYWRPKPGDFIDLKFTLDSNNGKDVFIGIAEESIAGPVFAGKTYYAIIDVDMDGPNDSHPDITYRRYSGDPIEGSPADLGIWTATAYGDELTLEWEPQEGDYWIVIMNLDGSPGVDVDAGLGVKALFLNIIGRGLLFGGLVCAGIGVVIIYVAAVRRT
jgi:hypothetical protein